MTLEEAIKHEEILAKELDKLCKRYDDASGYNRSHNEDIRTTGAKKCADAAEEHRQLAEWLKDYKRLLEQEPKTGHWEWVQYDYNPKLGNWHCSECRCIIVACVGKEDKDGIPLYKYCPQCGVKIFEPQKRENE